MAKKKLSEEAKEILRGYVRAERDLIAVEKQLEKVKKDLAKLPSDASSFDIFSATHEVAFWQESQVEHQKTYDFYKERI